MRPCWTLGIEQAFLCFTCDVVAFQCDLTHLFVRLQQGQMTGRTQVSDAREPKPIRDRVGRRPRDRPVLPQSAAPYLPVKWLELSKGDEHAANT